MAECIKFSTSIIFINDNINFTRRKIMMNPNNNLHYMNHIPAQQMNRYAHESSIGIAGLPQYNKELNPMYKKVYEPLPILPKNNWLPY